MPMYPLTIKLNIIILTGAGLFANMKKNAETKGIPENSIWRGRLLRNISLKLRSMSGNNETLNKSLWRDNLNKGC
jgi:hypothetical protein